MASTATATAASGDGNKKNENGISADRDSEKTCATVIYFQVKSIEIKR